MEAAPERQRSKTNSMVDPAVLGIRRTNQNLRRGKPRDACRPGVGPDHVQMFLWWICSAGRRRVKKLLAAGFSRTVSNRRPCAGPLTAVGASRATWTQFGR